MTLISPSLLSANFLNLADEIAALEQAQADLIHIDVMDGHFVPNLTLGPPIIRAIKSIAKTPLDVHLMIDQPQFYIDQYVEAGADFLTIHVESLIHIERTITHIKSRGIKAGIALNPSTHENSIAYVADLVDLILIMSVNPGFGGQTFLPLAEKKITSVRQMLQQVNNDKCLISVDGGINKETAARCKKAGASCLVAGSYIFNSPNYKSAIADLRA